MASKESDKLRSEVQALQDKAHHLVEEAKKLIEWSKQLQKEHGCGPEKRE
jgi:hypothetical protein